MNKLNQRILILIALLSLSFNPASFAANSITVKGSDTILVLGQRWAEDYMKQHPDVTIQVTGGGSGVGLAALVNGEGVIF